MNLTREQLKARMEHAECVLRSMPRPVGTIAIDNILACYEDTDDRDEVWESIQAYGDIRARLAIFVELERTGIDFLERI